MPSSKEFEPTPTFYAASDVDKLEFPGIVEAVNARKSEVDDAVAKSDDVSVEDMKYYTWLVTSRSFSIRLSADDVSSGNAKSVRVMLPVFDMINHSGKSNAEMDILNPEKVRLLRKNVEGASASTDMATAVTSQG